MVGSWKPIDRAPLKRRIIILALLSMGWAVCVALRLVDLQVSDAGSLQDRARRQQEQVIKLAARRGMFYDRGGRVLAMSIEVDSAYAVPAEIENPLRTATALAPLLEPEPLRRAERRGRIQEKLQSDRAFVWVERKVGPEVRTRIESLGLKGIHFLREHQRFYPHGELASHVLGFVDIDNNGKEGLEGALDDRIHGEDGQLFALVDARRKQFLKATRGEMKPGDGIVVTIDATVQHIAERELRRALADTGSRSGSVIVMEPGTGDILAMANEPTFNPNRAGSHPAESRRNRAVADAYEPGSTFKVITMAAALERGLVDPHEIIDCGNGSVRVSGALIRDHKRFDRLSASEVLEESSNVGAIRIGQRLGRDELFETIRRFGIGERTGVDLPGESRGLLREPSEWSGVSQASISFGQEVSVTPLQMLTAIAAVGNGGVLQPPRLVLRQLDPDGAVLAEHPSAAPRTILAPSTVARLTRMMRGVVENGTAKAAKMEGYSVAGKTGTAEKIGPSGTYADDKHIASFAGFTPASRPAIAILVVLDEPRGSLFHGGDVAAPVFRRIALPVLRYLGVAPDAMESEGGQTARGVTSPRDRVAFASSGDGRKKARGVRDARDGRDEDQDDEEAVFEPAPLPALEAVVSGDSVLLPDMAGHTLRRAVAYLGRIGLSARVMSAAGADAAAAVIGTQVPQAGTLVSRGSEVVLTPGIPAPRPDDTAIEQETGAAVARASMH